MKKNIYIFIRNLLVFWFVIDFIPGLIVVGDNIMAKLFAAAIYALIISFLPVLLYFFKFPVHFWSKFIFGSLLTFLMFVFFIWGYTEVLTIVPGVVGNYDFLIFTTPRFFVVDSPILVISITVIVLNLCSIMLAKLSKIDSK